MNKKLLVIAIIIATSVSGVASYVPEVEAAIAEVSHDAGGVMTINPATGFPFWYEDVSGGGGDRLQPCLGMNADGTGIVDPNCGLVAGANFNPALSISFPTNFPSEFPFYSAAARILNVGPTGTGRVDFSAGLFGSFTGGVPAAGNQTTFLKINLGNFGNGELSPNSTYNVTHPFGLAFSFTTNALGLANAVNIQDGGLVAGDFLSLLPAVNTGFGQFLNAAQPIAAVGYVGNPLITQTLEGGGLLTITGPNIGGQGVNTVSTNLFNVAGKISPNNPPVINSIPAQTGAQNAAISFTATATDADFDPITFSIISRSNLANENAASINPTTGVFSWTPNAGGVFTFSIGASDGRITSATNVTITVSAPPVLTSISISPANSTVLVGATRQFTATALDQFGAPILPLPAINWRTDNANIASINRNSGLATGIALGTVTITARSGNVSGTASLTVSNAPVCQTGADTDLSGTISNLEIINYIGQWRIGNVPNLLILQAIGFWRTGTGC